MINLSKLKYNGKRGLFI